MIRPEDQRAIDDLFDRLRRVESTSGPRDREAEALIRRRLSENPAAAYYMAQAVIVQEAVLREQQARIEELERKASDEGLGFLDSIFGDEPPIEERQLPRRNPWDRPDTGGFLAGAAQTALGVTGGLLLGSAIAGMFTPPASADDPSLPNGLAGKDDIDDSGGDWADFDIGGGF